LNEFRFFRDSLVTHLDPMTTVTVTAPDRLSTVESLAAAAFASAGLGSVDHLKIWVRLHSHFAHVQSGGLSLSGDAQADGLLDHEPDDQ